MSEDLCTSLGRHEQPWLEFKQEISHRDTLGKVICALANDLPDHGGGDLLIGVTKSGHRIATDNSDEALLRTSSIRNEGNILPLPSMVVTAETFDGGPIIRVHVNASAFGPVRFRGIAWVRPGPLTKEATPDDERVLAERHRAGMLPPDLIPVAGATLADLDLELVSSTIVTALVAPEVIEENGRPLSQQLASLRLVDQAGTPTLLGVLVAAFDPSGFVPGAYLQFVRYDGPDEGSSISDETEIRDNLVTAVRKITELLQINVKHRVVETDVLTEAIVPDYPNGALREAVINAIVHRTYDASNAPVRVLWYIDRVEIHSPGGPFGVVTGDNFRRTTDYRNPNLASMMKSLGFLNRFGRGIARIEAELGKNGNPPAEYDVGQSWWSVTLRSAR